MRAAFRLGVARHSLSSSLCCASLHRRFVSHIRNVAIIAHVDHGKTTLCDELLKQSGSLAEAESAGAERIMDSNDLEKERGITILAKNTCVGYTADDGERYKINVIDTPGHSDFGGEVERVLSMADAALVLVDGTDGPMPQTTFVLKKALGLGMKAIVVVNKVDRPSARVDWVVDEMFNLFDQLGASEKQLDFSVVYASALQGYATENSSERSGTMRPLFEKIVSQVPPPDVDTEGPFQMQVSQLDYNDYVGALAIGRIQRGRAKKTAPLKVIDKNGDIRDGRVLQVLGFEGLQRVEVKEASAGDIVCIAGVENPRISDTLCAPERVELLPPLKVDEPTLHMTFLPNDSPLAGKDERSQYVTSSALSERLEKELITNVALRVELAPSGGFQVSGRGELHLGILVENMRREGYELAISKPEVIMRVENGQKMEPYERLVVDVEEDHQGTVMSQMGTRGGELRDMANFASRVRLEFSIPTRGLLGFRNDFLTLTSGTGLMYHVFEEYKQRKKGTVAERTNGVLIANGSGKSVAFALFGLQERGKLFIGPGEELYEGMIIGLHNRDNDLVVNATRAKQLTNMRASGSETAVILTKPQLFTLESAMSFVEEDELVEVTPSALRLRKKLLLESARKKVKRSKRRQ